MSDSQQSRKINRFFAEFIAKLRKWLNKIGSPIRISRRLVRQLLGASRGQQKYSSRKGRSAGFVLPTVTLVTLVVTLLVVTTVSRSSERAQSAANARQEQVFRNAATPIIDRARAKIDALLIDERLPRTTPPEDVLDSVITNDSGKYTFPDETRLQLVYNFPDTDQKINTTGAIDTKEYVASAWKFPVDTDNNGKFDSYGLYSILFRTRPPGITNRPLVPIEARALPMDETTLSSSCVQASGSANVANSGGWTLSSDNLLRKSFFVYAVTVPITDASSFPAANAASFELYNGVTSISAVELQQDRARSPQNNNAVFFEGDLELVKVATFRINGRIYTAGNLMVGANTDAPISFYQVSSSGGALDGTATTNSKLFGSCYYEKKNSEIIVAGQVVEGDTVDTNTGDLSVSSPGVVNVDLFYGAGPGVPPDTVSGGRVQINETNQSVNELSSKVALNDFAYNNRIAALVTEAINLNGVLTEFTKTSLKYANATKDPISVQEDLIKRIQDEALSSLSEVEAARRLAFEVYFRERTRRVTFAEVPFGATDSFPSPLLTRIKSDTEFAPPVSWMFPLYKDSGFGSELSLASVDDFKGRGGYLDDTKGISLAVAANRLKPQASDPTTVKVSNESLLGDRLLVGNGFPAKWLKKSEVTGQLDFVADAEPNYITLATGSSGVIWDNPTNAEDRYRNTRSVTLSSLGVTDRGGFWEISAALNPAVTDLADTTKPLTDDVSPKTGGLRVVTNAGIYSSRPEDTFLQRFRTGISDVTSTADYDESRMPFWNGSIAGNPITKLDERGFATTTNNFVVWPDSMPMTGGVKLDGTPDTRKGDLQMRATAIYHYKYDAFNPVGAPTDYQKPIACISSYYDSSTPITAKNGKVTNGSSGLIDAPWNFNANGRSNNGLVYQVGLTASDTTKLGFGSIKYDPATGLFSDFAPGANNPSDKSIDYSDRLAYQANLMFPNGRFANEPLREVLIKISAATTKNPKDANLTLPQQSTIDSNLCALQILDGTIKLANESSTTATVTLADNAGLDGNPEIPHGSFRESAFLDGREIKSLNRNESLTESANGNNTIGDTVAENGLAVAEKGRADIYDLEIEQRQPLEIRATDIDMDRLRGSKISGGNNKKGLNTDYLLPYSGLIYATREDALQDLSYFDKNSTNDPLATGTDENRRKALSSTDFLLDPTRKPSAIRLINGYRLWRSTLTTANLTNTNGSLPVSDTTYASYPFNEATKGEKGLTLVSNLPVYVKAQYDPISASATPAFNKHTKEEFTQLLNEDASNISTIWNNFYKRHADNGDGDKLDPNFACRPKQNTGCQIGDEWRPATVLADAVTVLSANYRDGYRTDGDYDLRNNANTSTSINWQSQLNPNSEKTKDSSYVLERRRNGFLNNNFVTNARWLSPVNSDGGAGASTNLWPGAPHNVASTNSNTNGNLVSYNANGVTPVQRRITFSEYGMEMCRKFPVSECTFSDWIKAGAGTTTMPDFNTDGTVSTSPNAPRFVSNEDSRYGRRLSFLRFNDIYQDGNQQLIMTGICPGGSYWPMVIGVTNGNLDTGFTYPQAMGGLTTPFDTQRNNSYGVVPCPETSITVEIPSNISQAEGRRRNQNTPLPGKTDGALETQLGDTVLPTPVVGNITNGNDNNDGEVISPVEGRRSTNNAVYRRYNFTVRINRRDLLAAGQTVRVKVTLFPTNARQGEVGDAFPLFTDPINNTKTDYLRRIYNMQGDAITLRNKAGAPVSVASGLGEYPAIATTATIVATGEPEDSGCLASDYCTYVSWTGPTTSTSDPTDKILTILVVRDSADEDPEQFRLSLDNLVTTTGTNTAKYRADNLPGARRADTNGNFSLRRGDIDISNNRPNPNDCFPSGGTALTNNNNDDRPRSTSQCGTTPDPDPEPPGGPSDSAVSWPVFASLPTFGRSPMAMIAPPAAAYPFYHNANPSGDFKFRPFRPPFRADGSTGFEGGRYVWGNDINGNGTQDTGERDDVFPDIPPSPGQLGEIPMLPGNLARSLTATDNSEHMSNSRPANQARTLWYRIAHEDGDRTGRSDRIKYHDNRNLFINNTAYPNVFDSSSRANLSSMGRLILPDMPCISLVNGVVDERCSSKSYIYGASAPDDASTTLLNPNLPHNPHFPSDNASIGQTASSTVIPASSYTVCGPSGSTRVYQASQNSFIGRTDIANTTPCPTNPTTAIRNFVGTLPTGTGTSLSGGTGLLSAKLNPGNTGTDAFVGLVPATSGTLTSTATPPAISPVIRAINTYSNNKVHVYNIANLGKLDGGVRVLNGTLTFRANCADPLNPSTDTACTPNSIRRGPSPVFIMRGAPNESIEFSGLKIVLDGVDPNNIFWVSSRTQERIELKSTGSNGSTADQDFLLNTGKAGSKNADDPAIAVGNRIIISSNPTPPPPLQPGQIYYILGINGNGNSAKLLLSTSPPPKPYPTKTNPQPKDAIDCSVKSKIPPSCPPVAKVDGAGEVKLANLPSFIFSGGTPDKANSATGATTPSIITGNFLGYNTGASLSAGQTEEDTTSVFAVTDNFTSFRGVRFLGLFGDNSKVANRTLFAAMTTVNQPAVVPVLQIHVPNATAASDNIQQPNPTTESGMNGTPTASLGQWTIRPTKTEVNVYFVAGNSPSRSDRTFRKSSTIFRQAADTSTVTTSGETGGGLANFVRFLENWEDVPIKIAGGFIQNTRSRYATAPWAVAPLSGGVSDLTSVFLNPVRPRANSTTVTGRILTGYNLQYMSTTINRIPYYTPPIRLWGYDVGLLTQQPDRFAERFASPIAGANEFFREVSADDPWVESLLCALEPSTITANSAKGIGVVPSDYKTRALRGNDLRPACNSKVNNEFKYGGEGDTPAISYQ